MAKKTIVDLGVTTSIDATDILHTSSWSSVDYYYTITVGNK